MEARRLGKYELLESIGRGGFGTVYRARETVLDVERAVKLLHPALIADTEFLERFRREAMIAARLEHPNIVPVYELDQDQGVYFLAMKFMPGGSLNDLLERQGRLPFERGVEITRQIAAALDFAHSFPQKLIHRDVKPGNILFTADGTACLNDFGFAKALQGVGSASLSSTGRMIGTPPYMAPEAWRGQDVSPATDVYGLACVFYEMITGVVLFSGRDTPEVITKHVITGPQFPQNWPEGVPQGLELILSKALAREPEERYHSAGEFATALAGLLAEAGIRVKEKKPQPRPVPPHPWWTRWHVWAGTAGIIVLVGFFIVRGCVTSPSPTIIASPTPSSTLTVTLNPTPIPSPSPTFTEAPTSTKTSTQSPTKTSAQIPNRSQSLGLVSQIGGSSFHVTGDGKALYLGVGPRVVILDMSNPNGLTYLGQTEVLFGLVTDLALDDGVLYILSEGKGLYVLDVSIPKDPELIGFYPANGSRIQIKDQFAYVGQYVFDISNPQHLVEVSTHDIQGEIIGINGNLAFFTDEGNLRIVDISNNDQPVEIGSYEISTYASDVAVHDNLVYLVSLESGVQIIDVSNPTQPRKIGSIEKGEDETIWAIEIFENLAYIADNNDRLRVINVSNLNHPEELASLNLGFGNLVTDIYLSGNYAFLSNYDGGVHVVNISNPNNPRIVSFYDTPSGHDMSITGNYALLAEGAALRIIDVSDPQEPRSLGLFATKANIESLTSNRQFAFLANWVRGLRIIDVSNPTVPVELGHFEVDGKTANSIEVEGDYIYISDRFNGGLWKIDISDPSAPKEVDFFQSDLTNYRVEEVDNNFIYLIEWEVGVHILDNLTGQLPEIGFYPGYFNQAVSLDGKLYLTGRDGLTILNLANPENPEKLSTFSLGVEGYSIDIDDGFAYVSGGNTLYRIAISNPESPESAGYIEIGGLYLYDLEVEDKLLYAMDAINGLFILRILE